MPSPSLGAPASGIADDIDLHPGSEQRPPCCCDEGGTGHGSPNDLVLSDEPRQNSAESDAGSGSSPTLAVTLNAVRIDAITTATATTAGKDPDETKDR